MPKATGQSLSNREIERQVAAGRADYERKRAAGLYAIGAHYDLEAHRLVLELTNGYSMGVPVDTLPHLAGATAAQLAEVEVSPAGMSLRIPALDADYSVPGLVMAMSAREIGRLGGQATSTRKQRASRANGKKGGRPRKTSG